MIKMVLSDISSLKQKLKALLMQLYISFTDFKQAYCPGILYGQTTFSDRILQKLKYAKASAWRLCAEGNLTVLLEVSFFSYVLTQGRNGRLIWQINKSETNSTDILVKRKDMTQTQYLYTAQCQLSVTNGFSLTVFFTA